MKKKLISLCLALVMVLALLPVTALAAENEPISAFAELKALIASGADTAHFYGPDPLVIEEDLTLPAGFMLGGPDVIIPAGVTLTIEGPLANFSAYNLTVNGTIICGTGSSIYAWDSLTVNGRIDLVGSNWIELSSDCILVNPQNITYGEQSYLQWTYDIFNDDAQLKAALKAAAANTDPNHRYWLDFAGQPVVDTDQCVPGNTVVWMGNLTIAQGCTLTIDNGGRIYAYDVTIEGTLENNGDLSIDSISATETGTYKGSGRLKVSRDYVEALEDVIIGLDLSEFDITEYDDSAWLLYYVGPSTGGGESGGDEIGGDESGDDEFDDEYQVHNIDFTSFEELMELIESGPMCDPYDDFYYNYVALDPLMIPKDLTIPANAYISAWGAPVTIANGVTVTLYGILDCVDLTVNGTLVNNCIIYAYDNLTVNGKLENNYVIVLMEYTNLSGENKIVYNAMANGKPGQLQRYYYPETIDQLVDCIKGLSASDDEIYWNVIYFYGEGDQVLDQDLHIPKQTDLTLVDCTFTVSKGATLTVDGGLEVWYQPLIVEGTLVNNHRIDLYYSYGASMRVANSGSYKGSGEIDIWYPDPDELEEAIEGLDLSSFDAVYDEEYYGWYLTPKAEVHTHSWDAGTVTTAATCTADGVMTYTCACGETKTEAIPAKGHSEVVDAAVEATCTASGKTAGKHCGVCGEVLTAQEIIPAKGHSEVTDAAVEATCTASGKTAGKHCGVCGEVLTAQEIIPAKGHSYENGTCVNCGKAEGDSEVALGDASGDGVINNIDAMMVLQYAVGLKDADAIALSACDVNNDGVVNNIDAMLILQYAVGLITEFHNAKA